MLASTFSAQAQEIYYDQIGWWSITYRRIANLSGCDAVAMFPDQTLLAMALIQIESAKEEWAFLISNPKWDSWVGKTTQHELRLVTTKRWQVRFSTTSDKRWLVLANAPINFINSIGDARSLRIANENRRPLTRSPLDMKDSSAAIKAVRNCVADLPNHVARIALSLWAVGLDDGSGASVASKNTAEMRDQSS